MIENFFTKIITAIITPFIALSGLFAPIPEVKDPTLGVALPNAAAVFETSLAAPISSSATTMTLTANSVRGGGSISGYTCFTVDEGSAQAEFVCGTVSGTTVSSLTRGISPADGITEDADLKFSHRRGANVKITDFPLIQLLKAQNNGDATYESPLQYASSLSTSTIAADDQNLVNVELLNSVAFDSAGVVEATETAAGYSEIATAAEAAASTSTGGTGRLVLPASMATSTYNAGTAANVIPVTTGSGTLDEDFIPHTFTATTTFATSTAIIGSFPAWQIGKNMTVITQTGTSTFSVPEGITKLKVQIQAGGGNGGSGGDGTASHREGGAGGGAGGYAMGFVDVTGTSTITVYVGTSTQRTTFGTIGDHFMTANPGATGLGESEANALGGTASGGDINITGQAGRGSDSQADVGVAGGVGGSSMLGLGGVGGGGEGSQDGSTGTGYGSGGGGGYGSANEGGQGAPGVIIIEW